MSRSARPGNGKGVRQDAHPETNKSAEEYAEAPAPATANQPTPIPALLSPALAVVEEINRLYSEICEIQIEAGRKALPHAIRIGELLIEQKGKLKHGGWLPWLKQNVKFSESTAQNYMGLFRKYGSNPQLVRDLNLKEAIKTLPSAPKTPAPKSKLAVKSGSPPKLRDRTDPPEEPSGNGAEENKWQLSFEEAVSLLEDAITTLQMVIGNAPGTEESAAAGSAIEQVNIVKSELVAYLSGRTQ